MNIVIEISMVLFAYLLGSIPFGYILTYKYTGKNIKDFGSGNIGSTNVKRLAGSRVSIQVQLLDMLKGLLPVGLTIILIYYEIVSDTAYIVYMVALASILGHDFSVFLKFKGGKGVNTTLGASILFSPIPVLTGVVSYYIFKWSTKYVSLSSIILGISILITDALIYGFGNQFLYFVICNILIIVLHRDNIKRLLKGIEIKA